MITRSNWRAHGPRFYATFGLSVYCQKAKQRNSHVLISEENTQYLTFRTQFAFGREDFQLLAL